MGSAIKNLYEAKTELSSLVERASKGEEFVIAKNGVPMARLVALEPQVQRRPFGFWKGQVSIAKDFDKMADAELALWEADNVFPVTPSTTKRKRKTA